ncbi:MAG TPA: ABC transporter ATP-binding protein [Candidatus Dormibacteraeota bacterium]|nr:ABC transporter ATP-binding protein [Candidatus Dormibacteraeota bacterium]
MAARRESPGVKKSGSAVETVSLTKFYGRTLALNDCSFAVPRGRFVGLVGPNGAGKSTLLNLMIGLLNPSSGDARVLGLNPRTDRQEVLGRVGFLAQDRPLYKGLTVADTLELGRRFSPHWDQRAAVSRIERLGIPPDRHVGRLSGGQQAQVSLTLALSKNPELLILDEPMASLDPVARQEFLDEVTAAAEHRTITVIMSSHVVAELGRVCDYLLILQSGRLLVSGPVDEIIESSGIDAKAVATTSRGWMTELELIVMSYLAKGQ